MVDYFDGAKEWKVYTLHRLKSLRHAQSSSIKSRWEAILA